jgi:uncharacterized protein YwqG
MKLEEFRNKLEKIGIGKHFDSLQLSLRNSIRLHHKSTDEINIKLGQTKIGGKPDLPKEIKWVTETNIIKEKKILFFKIKKENVITKPLAFIAQINLSEISAFDHENLMPKTGLLYFFYSADQEAWGFDPTDKNKFKIIYWDGDINTLSRVDFPSDLPDYACYKPCFVELVSEVNFPSYEHEVYKTFSEEEVEKFWEEFSSEGHINKLLGYSNTIQNEMELECELVTNGLYCGDSTGYNNQRAKSLEPNAKDWLLLLQIDSNDENRMMWGDVGRLYFWIKKDDLLNKQFDKAWFCLQCY